MNAMIVVDMQVGLLQGPPKHDLEGVIARINALAAMVRQKAGTVVWVRHRGRPGQDFAPDRPGFALLPALDRRDNDLTVEKTLNDPYVGTPLQALLAERAPRRVLVTGWATDFCVDATVRSTVACDQHVVVPSDAHTLADRPHLAAAAVIAHHNWIWTNLITNRSVQVVPTRELLQP
jgi:nicotinamidase-related amidase